ncbi:MAG TPA: RsbRD N-terminal domain-containing protein [Nitrospirota bacterium]|nr:RsbRD N-terminal domain-containing protein [Nitrospirota bacterium]
MVLAKYTDMSLKDVLKEKKSRIVKKWFEAVLETYHENARGPLGKREAQFTNPVGYNLSQGIEGLFDATLEGLIPDDVSRFLDDMIRIRAVQAFTPSQAVAFIFEAKRIVRKELANELLHDPRMREELEAWDSAVDDLVLFSFDIYMQCREKIYDLKANEARNLTFRLLQKAKLITEDQE